MVNVAIELNGQPPLQVYIKPSKDYRITLRSIDLGAMEQIQTWEELSDFNKVGSPFSILKRHWLWPDSYPVFQQISSLPWKNS